MGSTPCSPIILLGRHFVQELNCSHKHEQKRVSLAITNAIKKPQSNIDYNVSKKGVDISDQMLFYYSPLKISRKLYKQVTLELITGTSIVNALVI